MKEQLCDKEAESVEVDVKAAAEAVATKAGAEVKTEMKVKAEAVKVEGKAVEVKAVEVKAEAVAKAVGVKAEAVEVEAEGRSGPVASAELSLLREHSSHQPPSGFESGCRSSNSRSSYVTVASEMEETEERASPLAPRPSPLAPRPNLRPNPRPNPRPGQSQDVFIRLTYLQPLLQAGHA